MIWLCPGLTQPQALFARTKTNQIRHVWTIVYVLSATHRFATNTVSTAHVWISDLLFSWIHSFIRDGFPPFVHSLLEQMVGPGQPRWDRGLGDTEPTEDTIPGVHLRWTSLHRGRHCRHYDPSIGYRAELLHVSLTLKRTGFRLPGTISVTPQRVRHGIHDI